MILLSIKLFLISKFLVTGTNADTTGNVDPYRFVCDIEWNQQGMPPKLPDQCTALATSNETDIGMMEIGSFRQPDTMPFMRVFSDVKFDSWKDVFSNPDKTNRYVEIIKDSKITAVAFDYMYSEDENEKLDSEKSKLIAEFIKSLKSQCKSTIFGIVIPNKKEKIVNAFDLNILEPILDFYILKANNIRKCGIDHEFFGLDKTDNSRTVTEADMENSVKCILEQGYKTNKVLLYVDLYVNTFRQITGDGRRTVISYGDVCSIEHSDDRVLCKDTLEQIFTKAKLANMYQMKGIYVMSLNADDFEGKCNCRGDDNNELYPAIKIMDLGLKGEGNGGKLAQCKSWAKYDD